MHQWYFYMHVFFHSTHTAHYVLLFFHYETSDYQLSPHVERIGSLKLSITSNTYYHSILCRNDGLPGISILKIFVNVFFEWILIIVYVCHRHIYSLCSGRCEGATKCLQRIEDNLGVAFLLI